MKIGARIAQMAGLSGTITLEQALYTGSYGFPEVIQFPTMGPLLVPYFFLTSSSWPFLVLPSPLFVSWNYLLY